MSDDTPRFLDLCVLGQATGTEIDDFVDSWHESESSETLAEFLGMTRLEYERWVVHPASLAAIIQSRIASANTSSVASSVAS